MVRSNLTIVGVMTSEHFIKDLVYMLTLYENNKIILEIFEDKG